MRISALLCCLAVASCQSLPGSPQAQIDKLAGTAWRVAEIGGAALSSGIESTLEFDAQARVAGLGGCNPYVSDIGIESDSVRFAEVLAAEINCTPEQTHQEKRFFDALAATRATRIEKNHLLLLDEAGTPLVVLSRLTLTIKPP